MDFMETGKLMVEPFELERILELTMEKKLNEHATLTVRGVLKDGQEDSVIQDVTEETKLKFKHGDELLFCGPIQNVRVTCENNVYYLEASAVSNSILLDLVPKMRSFQKNGMEFKAIAENVIKETGAKMTHETAVKTVETIILQYGETDWQFIRRLASHSNAVLVPVAASEETEFLFGIPEGVEYKEKLEAFNYAVSRNLHMYRELSRCDELSFEKEDAVVYTIKTDDYIFDLGDMLTLNDSPLYVYEAELLLKDSVLVCTYLLSSKNALSVPKYYNKHIAGLTLGGTVLKAEGDKVKVHLAIDSDQKEEDAYPFSYATSYTAEDHTGWYVMPEEGDTVQVLFPTEDETKAYSNMALRQKDSDRTTDPLVKYLRTPFGKEIKLDKSEVLITGKDETTFIRINEESGIDIITDKPINVTSGDVITMTSTNDFNIDCGKNLNIKAGESIHVTCKDNEIHIESDGNGIEAKAKKPIKVTGDDVIEMRNKKDFTAATKANFIVSAEKKMDVSANETMEVVCKENSVKLESGGSGILMDSGKAIAITGSNKVDISGDQNVSVSSSKGLSLSAGQKAELSGGSAVELSGSASSIKMDANIDLKAALIKEN